MWVDILYLKSFYFLPAYKHTFIALLRCSGFFALFHGLAALVPESSVFFHNLASVCKVCWVYNYLSLMLSNFNPNGFGGMRENIEVAGSILEKAKFPELKNKICCILCAGARRFTPNVQWLDSCVSRVRVYLWGSVVVVVVTQVLDDQKLLLNSDGTPKISQRLMKVIEVVFLLYGVSGFMSLKSLLLPLLLPSHRHHVVARAILSTVFFTWIGGLQNVLLIAVLKLPRNTVYAFINIEMFVFQIFCHKYYVPSFEWGFSPPKFHSSADSKQELSDYQFLIPIEDMAATVMKESTLTHIAKEIYDIASTTEAGGDKDEVGL
jgi:hypothetical protein